MRPKLRGVGRVLLAGTEAVLAAWVVLAVVLLQALQSDLQSGSVNREAAGGVAFFLLILWAVGAVVLAVLVTGQLVVSGLRTGRSDGVGPLTEPLARQAVELGVGLSLGVVLVGGGPAPEPFRSVLLASAAVSVAVLLHLAVDAGKLIREWAASR